jgi:2-polyprenyl-3-methyl-5-hydroxy-6-metoxy-1,4-benzoquinol methylase
MNGRLMLKLNAGSGKDYREGWINVDINPMWKTDWVMDLSAKELDLPFWGQFDVIVANDLLEHVPDLVQLMTNFCGMLKVGGTLEISVPYDLSYGAWQDPTHVRAFNERSWLYYTDWHWYLGWTTHKFILDMLFYEYSDVGKEMQDRGVLAYLIHRTPRAVDSMKIVLRKIQC